MCVLFATLVAFWKYEASYLTAEKVPRLTNSKRNNQNVSLSPHQTTIKFIASDYRALFFESQLCNVRNFILMDL